MNREWDVEFVGVLATEEEIQKRPIMINSQNSIQFYVKLISDTPYDFPNVQLFTFYPNELKQYGFEDEYYRPEEDRKEGLERFLNNYLIIFKPVKKVLHNHKEVYMGKNIRLVRKSDSYTDGTTYIPFPVFSQEEHGITFDVFVSKIINNGYVGKIHNISKDLNDTPQFILWKENEKYKILGEFTSHQYAFGGFSFQLANQLKTQIFQERWLEDCYSTPENPTLIFIPLNIVREIDQVMKESLPCEALLGQMEASSTLQKEGEDKKLMDKENMQPDATNPYYDENRFMEHFIQTTKEMGLQYNEKDLYNFHAAIKSGSLTILAGMSGTGKSKLVQAYARALNLDDDQFLMIPVRPSWTDDSDLIGYVDMMNMVYRPGDSGLMNTLIQAQEHREDKLYIICFDEMNLARVEHYFSQFLSVLEMEPQKRFIKLYNKDLTGRLYNTAQYEPEVLIPENVKFVGTVNIDESTHHFSDKVLDRANVISLEVLPYSGLRSSGQKERKQPRDQQGRKAICSWQDFKSFCNMDKFSLSDREVDMLWGIHNAMQDCSKDFGVGPRIVRQIDAYMGNVPVNPHLSRKDAMDIQIVQRIFTKLRGPEGLLRDLIGKMDGNGNVSDSMLAELLNEYADVSDFTESRKVLIQKAKELKNNGYTI
ncbi:hypothetical protein ABD76_16645 [Paenibacillus dendritiformis]|uniref:McrB family protein n=1 Tax=Paenibacillus dendritiformis TaxID=130049 RepID=UPI0018CD8561|nr:AAA family ATPase [Paenibacillus dendritiformis]MBG9794044.1 hypothetical protein [Paenibacillus dendritiformis]